MAIQPDPAELAAAPSIMLGHRSFKVLELVPTQNEIVTPAIFDLFEVFIRAKMAAESGNLLGMRLSTEEYRKLLDITAVAISRAHPEVKREDFNEMPIKTLQLITGFLTIAQQAGVVPEEVAKPAIPLDGKTPSSSGSMPVATSEAAPVSPPTGAPSPSRSPSAPAGTSIESEQLLPQAASS